MKKFVLALLCVMCSLSYASESVLMVEMAGRTFPIVSHSSQILNPSRTPVSSFMFKILDSEDSRVCFYGKITDGASLMYKLYILAYESGLDIQLAQQRRYSDAGLEMTFEYKHPTLNKDFKRTFDLTACQ